MLTHRGYGVRHADSETDSDGDGGPAKKLGGSGHIELSTKGIPHGILHFVEQLRMAGHIYMHDTCAPEASHRQYIKKAMDRVRKSTDQETSQSMISWVCRVRAWEKITTDVLHEHDLQNPCKRRRKTSSPKSLNVVFSASKVHSTLPNLEAGGKQFMSSDARLTYDEVTHACLNDAYMHYHMCFMLYEWSNMLMHALIITYDLLCMIYLIWPVKYC